MRAPASLDDPNRLFGERLSGPDTTGTYVGHNPYAAPVPLPPPPPKSGGVSPTQNMNGENTNVNGDMSTCWDNNTAAPTTLVSDGGYVDPYAAQQQAQSGPTNPAESSSQLGGYTDPYAQQGNYQVGNSTGSKATAVTGSKSPPPAGRAMPAAMGINPMYQAGAQTRKTTQNQSKIDPANIPRPAMPHSTSTKDPHGRGGASGGRVYHTDKYLHMQR